MQASRQAGRRMDYSVVGDEGKEVHQELRLDKMVKMVFFLECSVLGTFPLYFCMNVFVFMCV